jgi:hypothetical protein
MVRRAPHARSAGSAPAPGSARRTRCDGRRRPRPCAPRRATRPLRRQRRAALPQARSRATVPATLRCIAACDWRPVWRARQRAGRGWSLIWRGSCPSAGRLRRTIARRIRRRPQGAPGQVRWRRTERQPSLQSRASAQLSQPRAHLARRRRLGPSPLGLPLRRPARRCCTSGAPECTPPLRASAVPPMQRRIRRRPTGGGPACPPLLRAGRRAGALPCSGAVQRTRRPRGRGQLPRSGRAPPGSARSWLPLRRAAGRWQAQGPGRRRPGLLRARACAPPALCSVCWVRPHARARPMMRTPCRQHARSARAGSSRPATCPPDGAC